MSLAPVGKESEARFAAAALYGTSDAGAGGEPRGA